MTDLRTLAQQAKDSAPNWYEFHNFIDTFLTPTDAAFIAAANPTVILSLLDQLAAAEAECERLRAVALVERLTAKLEAMTLERNNLSIDVETYKHLGAECERTRGVYEAALEWRERIRARPSAAAQGVVVGLADTLVDAIDHALASGVEGEET